MFKYTLRNFLKDGYAPVMLQKIKKRLFEQENKQILENNLAWCRQVYQDSEAIAKRLDSFLWQESKRFKEDFDLRAESILKEADVDLGGGGYYAFLYFITRYFKPEIVVETGVAAGYSTEAFLKAMKINNKGRLYSSDFPYFRLKYPEKYIGILVEDELKSNWQLYIRGDRDNLPRISGQVPKIDIFHYDSDKTYSGRQFAMSIIEKLLHKDSIVVMDDIQDNLFFRDYVSKHDYHWKVFKFCQKYIGVIGRIF